MTRYLVDTNVISAGAPSKAVSAEGLLKWMDEHSTKLYLSVVTVAEIEDGIAKARRERPDGKQLTLLPGSRLYFISMAIAHFPLMWRAHALPESYRMSRAAGALVPDLLTS